MSELRGSRAHVFVDDLDDLRLDDNDRHHLARVLRLAAGDRLTVSDGRGGTLACRFGDEIEPAGPVVHAASPEPPVAIAFAVVKGERPDWAVQKLTEVGVDRIIPMLTDRSVVRWSGSRGDRHVERLRRVAREAAMQARLSRLPEIEEVQAFVDVAGRPGAVLADAGGARPELSSPLVLVGPEGGWSDAEREVGASRISLGGTVLRSETAAVAAGVLLTSLRPGGALTAKGG